MFIEDPKLAFELTDAQCRRFAWKLSLAMKRHEASWNGEQYAISILAAANDDNNVALALALSWNEALDFVRKYSGKTNETSSGWSLRSTKPNKDR